MATRPLDDEHTVFEYLLHIAVYRSFPSRKDLTTENVETLTHVLACGSTNQDFSHPGVNKCYNIGWLHSELANPEASEIFVFPSRLHFNFCEYLLATRDPHPFPFNLYPDAQTLCIEALKLFPKTNLQLCSTDRRLRTADSLLLPKAQFQSELYRTIYQLLGGLGTI